MRPTWNHLQLNPQCIVIFSLFATTCMREDVVLGIYLQLQAVSKLAKFTVYFYGTPQEATVAQLYLNFKELSKTNVQVINLIS